MLGIVHETNAIDKRYHRIGLTFGWHDLKDSAWRHEVAMVIFCFRHTFTRRWLKR